MASKITRSPEDGVIYIRISNIMTVADQQALDGWIKRVMDAGEKVSVLAVLENFEGWEKSAHDDLQFALEYSSRVFRSAVVGDEQWRDQALMYLGKGFRKTEIEYFPTGSLEAAKVWIRR